MIFRTYHEEMLYVIEAPEGSRVALLDDQTEELVVFEEMPRGTRIERRLPLSVVVRAALRGSNGLMIRDRRNPVPHPEAGCCCPTK